MSADYKQYLKTLRRIPDEIVLAVASRDLVLSEGESCLCGWVVREGLARLRNADAANVAGSDNDNDQACATLYGGELEEWQQIFYGVNDEATVSEYDWTTGVTAFIPNPDYRLPAVERAFVERVQEACANG